MEVFQKSIGCPKTFFPPVYHGWMDACEIPSPCSPPVFSLFRKFLKSIKIKGNCPKVWLLVPVWAPMALRGDWNWEPPWNWGSRIQPLCLGHCSGRMRHINIYRYEKFIPSCSCAQQMQFMRSMHFKEEPQTPLKFKVCLDIFIFCSSCQPGWEWLLSGVVLLTATVGR